MNTGTKRIVALSTSIALFTAGCADLTPGENAGLFGSIAAIAGQQIASAAGVGPLGSLAIGAAAGGLVALTAYVVAKHQATERQRRLAEARARVYYGRLAPSKKIAMKKRKVRYIAVDTERNEKTSPKAKKVVMIWDTQAETVVGNNVYDVEKTPPVGSIAKFDTYSADYVGSGR